MKKVFEKQLLMNLKMKKQLNFTLIERVSR